jgi:predicted HAD superfamily hydrolase
MTTSNFVFSRTLWERLGDFRDLRFVHDYDYLLRALVAGGRLGWVERKLLDYRLHESNTISENPLNANLECAALLRGHLPALIALPGDSGPRLERLASQWSRTERYEVEILRALQHEALVGKDTDWGRLVADRDKVIVDRDDALRDHARLLSERDRMIFERDQMIGERDRTVGELSHRLYLHEARPYAYAAARLRAAVGRRVRRLGSIPGALRRLASTTAMPASAAPVARVGGFAALRRYVERRPQELKCLSFDVFDTLLFRCIEPPEWLHRRVAEELAAALGAPHTPASVLAARREAEAALRAQAIERGDDHECHFDELLCAWVARLCGAEDAVLIARAEAIERELEHLALAAKPGAILFLQWARSRGLRVVAVSDMYLGETQVREILDRCGFGGLLDAVYVSSDHRVAKHSTRLHAKVLELEGVLPAEVLHVGDNFASDALAPSRLGIQGVFLDERAQRLRRRRQSLAAEMSARGGIWPGRMLNEIVAERLKHDGRAKRDDFYFQYGLEVLGPMFSLFTLGLVERLRADPSDRVFFLARDGQLFMQLYEAWRRLDADGAALPTATYAYASRRVVASAAVAEGLDLQMCFIALSNPKQQGLQSILRTYGLPPDAFGEFAREHGFPDLRERLGDWHDARLQAFLADERVQRIVLAHGAKARDCLEAYFESLGFFASRAVTLVDIGWNGTIQHFLGETFGARGDYPRVAGYYFALANSFHRTSATGGVTEGLILDTRRNNPCERAACDFEELFEQGARSLEATTIGYARSDAGVVPLLKDDDAADRQEELRCNPSIAAMQEGVMLHLEHFHAARRLTGFGFDALKPYVLGLVERAVVYPDVDEVAHIGRLAHTEDFGHDHVLDISAGGVGWRDYLWPRRLARKVRALAWRYAPFARFRFPLPALLARVSHLRHLRGRAA